MRGISCRLQSVRSSSTRILFSILVTLAHLSSVSFAADMVPWVDNLHTAQQMAASRNQLILIHFYSNNCPPCRRLEKNVFSRPGFGHGVARNYVPVRINASVSPDLARKFNVSQWPTDLMLTSQGEEVHRMVSPQDLNEYLRILNQVAWRMNSMPAGTPVQMVSQGFVNDANPRSSTVGSDSPFQFAVEAPPASAISSPTDSTEERPIPKYELGSQVAQAVAAPQGSVATTVLPAPKSQGFITNQFATNPANGPPQASFPQASSPAEQQIAMAQQQLARAREQASQPRFIENEFASTSQPKTPLSNVFSSQPIVPQNSVSPPPTNSQSHAWKQAAQSSPSQSSPGQPSPAQLTPTTQPNPANQPHPPQSSLPFAGPALSAPNPAFGRPTGSPPTSEVANSIAPRQAVTPSANRQPMDPQLTTNTHSPISQSSPQQTQSSPQQTPTPKAAEFGLEGYCPVTLIEGDKWVKGDKRWGARHRGRLYLFQTAAAQQKFLASPDRFSPVLAGFDPVEFAERGQYAEGMRTHGIRYQDQIYLFVSEESLSRFAQSPDRFAEVAQRAIGGGRKLR